MSRVPLVPVDQFLASFHELEPVTATFAGIHVHDERYPDWSSHREIDGWAWTPLRVDEEELARRMRDDPSFLDATLAYTSGFVRYGENASRHFHALNPALWTGEAVFGIVSLMLRDFAPAPERLASIEARLRDLPRFLDDLPRRIVDVERVPTLWRDRAARECATADTLVKTSLREWCASQGLVYPAPAALLARQAIIELQRWLKGLPSFHVDPPALTGDAMESWLTAGHWSSEGTERLTRRAEVAMEEERDALAADVYVFPGQSWSAVQAAIAADHPSPGDFHGAFDRRWAEIREATSDLVTWPGHDEWPIRYQPFPEWAREIAPSLYWLFYRSPSPFDPPRTHDYWTPVVDESLPPDVLGARLASWNNTQITLNHVVHHGGIGHHVQNWHATTRSKSQIGRIAAVDAASRIALFCGGTMAEGWACYATGLVEERGLLTRLERLSEQHTRVRLLARCIVDLRFHLGDWSFDECVAYWQRSTESPKELGIAEVTKISMFPGTGLMYWLGVDAIRSARRTLERTRGSAFSLKQFHDDLLSWGSIPAPLVARMLTA